MRYEWSIAKEIVNRRKHGVDFAAAIGALEDPDRLEEIDSRFDYDEERIVVIGITHGLVMFVVVTFRGQDTCRIISARRATRNEQNRYYARRREDW